VATAEAADRPSWLDPKSMEPAYVTASSLETIKSVRPELPHLALWVEPDISDAGMALQERLASKLSTPKHDKANQLPLYVTALQDPLTPSSTDSDDFPHGGLKSFKQPRPQVLVCHAVDGGAHRVRWTVDAKRLRSSDKVAVSPSFSIPFVAGSFKLMLSPTAVSDRKGGASFKKANGRGQVQLKCEAGLGEDPGGSHGKLGVRISVGSAWEEVVNSKRWEQSTDCVVHDFADVGVVSLPRHSEDYNFTQAVDEASQTFTLYLEVFSPSRSLGPAVVEPVAADA